MEAYSKRVSPVISADEPVGVLGVLREISGVLVGLSGGVPGICTVSLGLEVAVATGAFSLLQLQPAILPAADQTQIV